VSIVEELRPKIRAGQRKSPPPWQPPVLGDFAPDRLVTAFDQTLSHCGHVSLATGRSGDPAIIVVQYGTLHPKSRRNGFLMSWDRAMELRHLLHAAYPDYIGLGTVIVEQPLVGPGHRPESALLAGSVIYTWQAGAVVTYSARRAGSVLCGDASHDKKKIAEAVARYIPESADRTWSEHTRDAAAMALAWLYDQAHRDL
jgi:Holliday junction resolvasome RuvABC endonuclease subunit